MAKLLLFITSGAHVGPLTLLRRQFYIHVSGGRVGENLNTKLEI
jgi:hypothetical protein